MGRVKPSRSGFFDLLYPRLACLNQQRRCLLFTVACWAKHVRGGDVHVTDNNNNNSNNLSKSSSLEHNNNNISQCEKTKRHRQEITKKNEHFMSHVPFEGVFLLALLTLRRPQHSERQRTSPALSKALRDDRVKPDRQNKKKAQSQEGY